MSQFPGGPDTNELLLAGTFGEVIAAQLDGDGLLDLAVASPLEGGVQVLLNDGAGGFPSATFFATGVRAQSLAAGDLDLDGHVDLAVANLGGDDVSLLAGDGLGSFAPLATQAVAPRPIDIELTDLEGDGDLDLVVAGGASGRLTVGLNQLLP